MNDLDHRFDQAKQLPVPLLWEDVERRAALGEDTHEDTAQAHPVRAVLALAVSLAVIGTTLYALRDLGGHDATTGVLSPGEVIRYRLDGPPQPIAVGAGAAWVHVGGGPGTVSGLGGLVRIDAVTGQRRMLDVPGGDWPAVGGGSAWLLCNADACDGGSVIQIDPVTGEIVRTVVLPGRGNQIVGTTTGVWVTTDAGASFIDSEGVLRQTIEGKRFVLIGTDEASLWVSTDAGVRGFDLLDGNQIAEVPFGDVCTMEVANGMVWVASCGGGPLPLSDRDVLMGIDATTGHELFHVAIDGYGQMRYSDGVLWIAELGPMDSRSIRLVPFDPSSGLRAGQPMEFESSELRFSVPSPVPPRPFFAIGEGSAWLTDYGAGEVIRVELPRAEAGDAPAVPEDVLRAALDGVQADYGRGDSVISVQATAAVTMEEWVALEPRQAEEHPITEKNRTDLVYAATFTGSFGVDPPASLIEPDASDRQGLVPYTDGRVVFDSRGSTLMIQLRSSDARGAQPFGDPIYSGAGT